MQLREKPTAKVFVYWYKKELNKYSVHFKFFMYEKLKYYS